MTHTFVWSLTYVQCTATSMRPVCDQSVFVGRNHSLSSGKHLLPFSTLFSTWLLFFHDFFDQKYIFISRKIRHEVFSNISREDLRHKMSVFNDSLMHGYFRVFWDSTTCTIFDIPSLACRIVHDYHSSCSEIFRHIWNWRVYPLRSGAWKLSSSDWLIRLSLILPLQNFIKN